MCTYPGLLFALLFTLFLTAWLVPLVHFDADASLVARLARSAEERGSGLPDGGTGMEETEESLVVSRPEEKPPRNVLLCIIESYGYTAYAKADHAAILEPYLREQEERLAAAGYRILSTFLKSPVIGGYSWYADSTLLTGMRINSEEQYGELLRSKTPNLVGLLDERGYRTVLVAPGTLKPWPEGEAYYQFDHYLYNADFGYRGPEFSFVPVPDQYSLNKLHRRFIAAGDGGPLFAEFLLVSSHAPFNRIPPYVEDWDSLGDGSIYHELPMLTFKNTWFQGKEYAEGYTAAIKYVFDVLVAYLTEFLEDDTLIIITGDHQPKYPVTERGQPLSVPMHVLCRDWSLIEPLVGYGYVDGVPTQQPPHDGLESFYEQFMALLPNL
jgi:hypothetical protein